jgi:hypothetical protein
MIGRDRVVADETPSQMCSARWEMQKRAPRAVCNTFPAPAVPGRIGVVLEEVDVAGDALLPEARFGRSQQIFEDALPCLVVNDQVVNGVALGRGVFRVRGPLNVQVTPNSFSVPKMRRSTGQG